MANEYALEFDQITKLFGDFKALDKVSLHVLPGSITWQRLALVLLLPPILRQPRNAAPTPRPDLSITNLLSSMEAR